MLFTVQNTVAFDRGLIPGLGVRERHSYTLTPARLAALVMRIEHMISAGSVVTAATLVLPVIGPPGQSVWVGAARILRPWDPDDVSWEYPWSRPGGAEGVDFGTIRSSPVTAGAAGGVVQVPLDVTEDVRRWVSGQATNQGWMLHGSAKIGGARNPLISATPRLDVKYSEGEGAAFGAGLPGGV